MATSLMTVATRSMVSADLTVITAGHTATLDSVALLPNLGPNRLIRLSLTVDGTTTLEMDILMRDEAFEEFDLFGGRKGTGPASGEAAGLS